LKSEIKILRRISMRLIVIIRYIVDLIIISNIHLIITDLITTRPTTTTTTTIPDNTTWVGMTTEEEIISIQGKSFLNSNKITPIYGYNLEPF
jgi:hypothetical protein